MCQIELVMLVPWRLFFKGLVFMLPVTSEYFLYEKIPSLCSCSRFFADLRLKAMDHNLQ